MTKNETPKTVLITGTSSGFGKTAARLFANNGWNVVATMRRPATEKELVGRDDVLVTRLDVQDRPSIAEAIEVGITHFGRIDALINNAGFGLYGLFEATPIEKVREQFDVNVFGAMDVTRAIFATLSEQQGRSDSQCQFWRRGLHAAAALIVLRQQVCFGGLFGVTVLRAPASQNIVVKIIEPGGVLARILEKEVARRLHATPRWRITTPSWPTQTRFLPGLRAARLATEEDVARVIFEAATDGTDQLRYVATRDIAPLVKARRETSEQEYITYMRSRFFPREQGTR